MSRARLSLGDVNQQTEPPAAEDRTFLLHGLARELFTLRRDPLPKMSRPRWLAWLPHVVLTYAAIPCGVLTGMQLNDHYGVYGAAVLGLSLLTSASVLLSMVRPIAAWWLGLVTTTLVAWAIHDHVGQGSPGRGRPPGRSRSRP